MAHTARKAWQARGQRISRRLPKLSNVAGREVGERYGSLTKMTIRDEDLVLSTDGQELSFLLSSYAVSGKQTRL